MATKEDNSMSASLSLMRRLPPNKVEQNLTGLTNLLPDDADELLQRIDLPLQEEKDAENGRTYLLCDYNRDGDSHRSPWSNNYYPPLEDGFLPSARIRQIEIEANELFDCYREQYYEGGTSSVYLWDLDNGFAGSFLIKKKVTGDRYVNKGSWDSVNVIEVIEESATKANYKLTTTVMLHMEVDKEDVGKTTLSGSLTRQTELNSVVNEVKTHIANIGRMIEDQESDMRSNLNELYIQKTREVVNSLRNASGGPTQTNAFTKSLNAAVLTHGAGRKVGDGDA